MKTNSQIPQLSNGYAMRLEIRKGVSTIGIDVTAVSSAPSGEGIGVDVCLYDRMSLANETLAALLGKVLPLQESTGQLMAVNEQGFQPIVIRFLVPHHTNYSDLLGQLAHNDDLSNSGETKMEKLDLSQKSKIETALCELAAQGGNEAQIALVKDALVKAFLELNSSISQRDS